MNDKKIIVVAPTIRQANQAGRMLARPFTAYSFVTLIHAMGYQGYTIFLVDCEDAAADANTLDRIAAISCGNDVYTLKTPRVGLAPRQR